MRRVLVPLDGSVFAESIIPDARRLAGPDGELILVRDARLPLLDRDIFVDSTMLAVEDSEWYLHHEVEKLREEGVNSRSQSFMLADAASAIDEAARIFKADIIAVATHGRGPFSRLLRGSVAWRAVAHSPVPVMLRHVDDPPALPQVEEGDRRIMVPLDGSGYAEKALRMAQELALEWKVPLWLVRVIPDVPLTDPSLAPVTPTTVLDEQENRDAQTYLEGVADRLPGEVHVHTARGLEVDTLVMAIKRFSITDVVLTSHGRTGLSRVIVGSIADEMIHAVHCPVFVVPALEPDRPEGQAERDGQSATAQP